MHNGRRWLSERSKLYVTSNILKHGSDKIVCPNALIADVLKLHHDSPLSGHRAYETTLVAIKNRYFWINMANEIKHYCNSCTACQKYNYACLHNKAPLKPLEVSRPWQLVGFDFMGPFKTSNHGNKYIILGIDHLTKFAEGAATPSFDAVIKFVNDDHNDWDLFLQMAISAYNNSYHSSIKMTPYQAQFSRPPVLVADIIMNNQLPANTRIKDVAEFTTALRKSAAYVSDMIRENTLSSRTRMKSNYDRFVQNKVHFKIGDFVKIDNCRIRVKKSKSFEPKFLGPYKITQRINELDYKIE